MRIEHLSKAQQRALAIADNRLTERSAWDDEILAKTLKELSAEDLGFDLEVTGFSTPEIDLRIANLTNPDPGSLGLDDQLPTIPKGPPVTRPGDLWYLGRHRAYCADALTASTYEALMGGVVAEAVIADPPYNVRIQGHAGGKGRIRHREFAAASGEMTRGQYTHFLVTALGHASRHSAGGSPPPRKRACGWAASFRWAMT